MIFKNKNRKITRLSLFSPLSPKFTKCTSWRSLHLLSLPSNDVLELFHKRHCLLLIQVSVPLLPVEDLLSLVLDHQVSGDPGADLLDGGVGEHSLDDFCSVGCLGVPSSGPAVDDLSLESCLVLRHVFEFLWNRVSTTH